MEVERNAPNTTLTFIPSRNGVFPYVLNFLHFEMANVPWYKMSQSVNHGKLAVYHPESTGQPGWFGSYHPPKINEFWRHDGKVRFFSRIPWMIGGKNPTWWRMLDGWCKLDGWIHADLMEHVGWLTLREVWSWRGNEVTSWRSNVKVWRCAMWRRNHWKTRELRLEDSEVVVEQKGTIQPGWWFQWIFFIVTPTWKDDPNWLVGCNHQLAPCCQRNKNLRFQA